MTERPRRCGTCKFWEHAGDPPFCGWETPKLPFWASISNGDHGDYTEADDGGRCPVWEAMPLCPI